MTLSLPLMNSFNKAEAAITDEDYACLGLSLCLRVIFYFTKISTIQNVKKYLISNVKTIYSYSHWVMNWLPWEQLSGWQTPDTRTTERTK